MDQPFLAFIKDRLASSGPSTFEGLAKQTGVPVGTIRKIHYGEVANPRIGTIQPLFDYFRAIDHRGTIPAREAA